MADVLAVRDEYRAQSWAMLIQESKPSGLTNKEFCEQRGISEKSFYYWQRKLRSHIIGDCLNLYLARLNLFHRNSVNPVTIIYKTG